MESWPDEWKQSYVKWYVKTYGKKPTMPRPKKDSTAPATSKVEEAADITVVKYLEIAYRFADGYIGANPEGSLVPDMLFACATISETINRLRPTIRMWEKMAVADRAAWEDYAEAAADRQVQLESA